MRKYGIREVFGFCKIKYKIKPWSDHREYHRSSILTTKYNVNTNNSLVHCIAQSTYATTYYFIVKIDLI